MNKKWNEFWDNLVDVTKPLDDTDELIIRLHKLVKETDELLAKVKVAEDNFDNMLSKVDKLVSKTISKA